MSAPSTVTVPSVQSGPAIANFAVTLPVGTVVTAADGTTSVLSAATTVMVQRVVACDADSGLPLDVAALVQAGLAEAARDLAAVRREVVGIRRGMEELLRTDLTYEEES